MWTRFTRGATTLVAILVTYQVYALVAVPLLEPELKVQARANVSEDDLAMARQRLTRYQTLLASYFPADHWSVVRPPKVIQSGPVMLVLDDYDQQPEGRVDITHCAVLMFPTPWQDGAAPRDAIVIEAPQGARLQFDDQFDPARGQIGQITRGEFPGPIIIRSDMRESGPQDDLLIETGDISMNTKRAYTDREVRFRMGPNRGQGRELEIRFLVDELASAKKSGLNIGGVESLEISRDVKLTMYMDMKSLLPGDNKPTNGKTKPATSATAWRDEPNKGEADAAPVNLTCSGPFRFNFLDYVASFDEDVNVWQLKPNGPSDQLVCQRLDIHFAPKATAEAASIRDQMNPSRQQKNLTNLDPSAIVAEGYPVTVSSPARQAEAQGERLQLELQQRIVTITGGRAARLVYGPNVIQAPSIEYQHPAAESQSKIGNFRAEGAGTLRFVPDPEKPQQVLQIGWQKSIRLARRNGQPRLTLLGRPQVELLDAGRMTADSIYLDVRELNIGAADSAPAGIGGKDFQVIPDRLIAKGQVVLQSPEMNARTNRLSAQFRVASTEKRAATARSAGRSASSSRSPMKFDSRPSQFNSSELYDIEAATIDVNAMVAGSRSIPEDLTCAGSVTFRQIDRQSGATALAVHGEQVEVQGLETGAARIAIIGHAADAAPGSELAWVEARGMTVSGAEIRLDQGQNRLWIDGPGEAALVIDRGLDGQPSATPFPLNLSWDGGLNFDGRRIVFGKNVRVDAPTDWLRTEQLTATLTRPVSFSQGVDQNAIDVAILLCEGGVAVDHHPADSVGPTSHDRLSLSQSLSVNMVTGAIAGQGRGWLRSVHFGGGLNQLAAPAAQLATNAEAGRQKLNFLRVDFERGLSGNLHHRELTFHERVKTIYGPVDRWDQELDPNRRPVGSMILACDDLGVNENPLAARAGWGPVGRPSTNRQLGPIQMRAAGNVTLEGDLEGQGIFAARGNLASYDQLKDAVILEGDPRTPALIKQQQPGGQPNEMSALKIHYTRPTGNVRMEGIQSLDIGPATPLNAIRPGMNGQRAN